MDLTKLEYNLRKILLLRQQKRELQNKINELTKEVMQQAKRYGKIADLVYQVQSRTRLDMDFRKIDELLDNGTIPPEVIKKSTYDRLIITKSEEFELVGNKFVRKDADK